MSDERSFLPRRRGASRDEDDDEHLLLSSPGSSARLDSRGQSRLLDPDAFHIPDVPETATDRLMQENEYLALDNLLLQRKTAEMERRLEIATLRNTPAGSLVGSLFGFPSAQQDRALHDSAVALQARADENLQLQHELFEQRRQHAAENEAYAETSAALERTLRHALAETESELRDVQAVAAADAEEAERQLAEQRSNLESLHGVCLELRLKCAATLDELEASHGVVARLRQRDAEHQEWRARVRRAWRREQQERNEAEARRLLGEQQGAAPLHPPTDELAMSGTSVASAGTQVASQASASAAGAAEGEGGTNGRRSSRDSDASSSTATPADGTSTAGGASPALAAEESPPAWLAAAERAVSLPYITEALDSNDGTTDDSSALLCPEGETDPTVLRSALAAERARREAAEARAEQAIEELKLSSARFQQQIAMLSDALSESHSKEEARKKRQAELRELQKQKQQQQASRQERQARQQSSSQPAEGQGTGVLGAAGSLLFGDGLSSGSLWSAK
jgi:hypothetical protein